MPAYSDIENPYDQGGASPEVEYDQWGRHPSDPWYGIPPGTGGQVPYAPGQGPGPAGPIDPNPEPGPESPPPNPPPPPPPPPPGGPSGGTEVPQFTAPTLPTITPFASTQNPYEYTAFQEGPAFDNAPYVFDNSPYEVGQFQAPTLDQAKNEPGYEFARTEGIRALMNANLGTLRHGGTLKNLIGWGDRFAEQNYGNVYNRAANTYGTNRDTTALNRNNAFEALQSNRNNAFQTHQTSRDNRFQTHNTNELGKLGQFTTNYGVERDTFDRNAGLSLDLYDRDLQGRRAEFDPRMQGYLALLQSLTQLGTAGANG